MEVIMTISDPVAKLLGTWSMEIGIWSVIFRLFLAVGLSAIIGCERSSKRHAAGLRTFILVTLASAVAMMIDVYLSILLSMQLAVISAAAMIGIAIISSNSILYSSKNQIKGLTTSVALWACGLLGFSIGAGFYTISVVFFLLLLFCLSLFPKIEIYLKNRSNHFEIHLELKSKSNLQEFVATLRTLGLKIDDIESNPAYLNSGLSVYSISLTIVSEELKKYKKHTEIIEALATLDYIHYIEEIN